PGGLTALAVLNFVFGGFSVLGVLAMAAIMGVAVAVEGQDTEESKKLAEAMAEAGSLFTVALIMSAISAFLLIASGVGYLQQKKFLGRTLGSIYAGLSILSSLVSSAWLSEELQGGFNITTIIGLIYPVLTLILLNGTFKNDFVR
ncbi:MAG: hypothetical protein ABL997_15950, partial [Planctomycetota bacterium]